MNDNREPIYVLLHGGGDSVDEMTRFIEQLQPQCEYVAFQAPHGRTFIPGYLWWSTDSDFDTRRQECHDAGKYITDWLCSTGLNSRDLVVVGFSQGAYLAFRMVADFPELYRQAILLNPPFPDTVSDNALPDPDRHARILLVYGEHDLVIPEDEQANASEVPTAMSVFLERLKILSHISRNMDRLL